MPPASRLRSGALTAAGLVVMIAFMLVASGLARHAAQARLPEGVAHAMPWAVYAFGHAGQLAAALACIAVLSRGRFREFGLRWPAAVSRGRRRSGRP